MVIEKDIIDVLEDEFVEYAAPIIINNLPSIDGLLPVNRKAIWGLHKAKITHDKPFIKMLRACGYIYPYYVFGDMPLTGALKNMANNTLNHFYLESKGNFGDKRRKNAPGASARYIETKLSEYGEYMLYGINKNNVPMKRNYDNTEDEPIILPSIIPNILANNSQSIAVGESSKIPSHNLIEVCDSFISYINTEDIDKSIELLKGADMPTHGKIIYDKEVFEKIYKTGRGSFTLTGDYVFDEKNNKITIIEAPYEAYIEDIEKKIRECYDKGLLKEMIDIHDGTDKEGIKLSIYLKKNTDVNLFMSKIRKYTPYQSTISCNFTILDLDGKTPVLMTLEDIINKWVAHRINCIKNELSWDVNDKNKKLHKLYGLQIISNDLDKAIEIIRGSKKEKEALEKLIEFFKLTEEQAAYISTIRLININQEWIYKQTKDMLNLEEEVKRLKETLDSDSEIKEIIVSQLKEVKNKYGKPRKTEVIYKDEIVATIDKSSLIPEYNCRILYTQQGYIKKHLKQSDNHKTKEDDTILGDITTSNKSTLLIFTNKGNRYKLPVHELETVQPSSYGTFIKNILDLEQDEQVIKIVSVDKEIGYMCFVYSNGKLAKIDIKSYMSANKKLQNCYNTDSNLIAIEYIQSDVDVLLVSSEGKALIINTQRVSSKGSRNSQGNVAIKLDTDFECVGSVIEVTKENNFKIFTVKGKELEFMLDDVAPTGKSNEERNLFNYLCGRPSNSGNFVYNSRNYSNEKVTLFETN